MSESKHTPGPWKRKDNFVYSPMFDEDDTLFVSIAVACTGIAPAIANANLIAAAPDMYEALEQMEPLINNSTGIVGYYMNGNIAKWNDFDVTRIIGKALRKARGKTE